MNEFQFEKLIREAAHKEKTNIPEDFNIMLKDTLNKLPEKEARKDGASGRMAGRRILTAAAVAAMLFVLLPNVSPSIAYAMEKLPVIGSVVKDHRKELHPFRRAQRSECSAARDTGSYGGRTAAQC